MLELQNITFKRDGKTILDSINLTLNDTGLTAITGPNGSGKSTLAKIIMGIEKPDSGKIIWNNKDITNTTLDERANLGIAFAFQNPVRFKGITVENMLELASNKKLSKKEACEVLSSVGLCADNYLSRELNSSLSGGEIKRIEIAGILLRNANLTIFDEPEAGIDLWSFQNLIQVFQNIQHDLKNTIIITHQERILNIVDDIILLENGKINYHGPAKTIIEDLLKSDCPNKKGGINHECCR